MIYFALSPETKVSLSKEHSNNSDVKSQLQSLTTMREGTNTGDALLAAKNMLDGPEHTLGAKKIIVLITDGLARKPQNLTRGTAHALDIASQCAESNITLLGVGFFHPDSGATAADGKNFMDKLKNKFGGDSTVYTVTTIDGLHGALNQLINKEMGVSALIN